MALGIFQQTLIDKLCANRSQIHRGVVLTPTAWKLWGGFGVLQPMGSKADHRFSEEGCEMLEPPGVGSPGPGVEETGLPEVPCSSVHPTWAVTRSLTVLTRSNIQHKLAGAKRKVQN